MFQVVETEKLVGYIKAIDHNDSKHASNFASALLELKTRNIIDDELCKELEYTLETTDEHEVIVAIIKYLSFPRMLSNLIGKIQHAALSMKLSDANEACLAAWLSKRRITIERNTDRQLAAEAESPIPTQALKILICALKDESLFQEAKQSGLDTHLMNHLIILFLENDECQQLIGTILFPLLVKLDPRKSLNDIWTLFMCIFESALDHSDTAPLLAGYICRLFDSFMIPERGIDLRSFETTFLIIQNGLVSQNTTCFKYCHFLLKLLVYFPGADFEPTKYFNTKSIDSFTLFFEVLDAFSESYAHLIPVQLPNLIKLFKELDPSWFIVLLRRGLNNGTTGIRHIILEYIVAITDTSILKVLAKDPRFMSG